MSNFDESFGDFFEEGAGGPPSVSWKQARKGATFEGVIVPADVSDPNKGYKTVQKTNMQNEPLFWNPVRGAKPAQLTAEQVESSGKAAKPVTQAVLTVSTAYRANEYLSENAVEFRKEEGQKDDGLRRYFVSGGSATTAFRDALKKAGAQRPEVGGTIKVTLVNRVNNDYGGKTNEFEATYLKPTPDSMKVVQAYMDEFASEPEGDEGGDFFSEPQNTDKSYDEPPF